MCIGNIKINDEVMEMVRPHFEGDKELWAWVENVVDQAMKDYAAQFTSALKDSHHSTLLKIFVMTISVRNTVYEGSGRY